VVAGVSGTGVSLVVPGLAEIDGEGSPEELVLGSTVGVGVRRGVEVCVGVGVADRVGVGVGLGVETPPWQVTLIVVGHWAMVARTVRWPSTGPKLTTTVVCALPSVTADFGVTLSAADGLFLKSQRTACPGTRTPDTASVTVAVTWAVESQRTGPDGPRICTTYGFWPTYPKTPAIGSTANKRASSPPAPIRTRERAPFTLRAIVHKIVTRPEIQ
jgi:hypothetical protein